MGLEWNTPEDISIFYRYSGGSWTRYYYYQTDDGIDIFADNFAVDDAVYFINNGYPNRQSHAHKFAGLQVVVDAAVQADTYEYVWEYYDNDGTWHELPSVNDPSNGFQNTGTHNITWDVPNTWRNSYRPCNTDWHSSGFVVRLRVTNVSNPSEGGRFGTSQTIKQYNYAYYINDGNTYEPDDIYQLDQSLGNNLVTKQDDQYYKVMANVIVNNGKLYIPPYTTLAVGNLTNASGYNTYGGFEVLMRSNGEIEIDGGFLDWHNSYYQGPYNYWYGKLTMKKGAWLKKAFGNYNAWTIACELDVEDSQIMSHYGSDTIYFYADAHGNVKRSNMITKNFFVYTSRINWNDVQMKTLGSVTTNYRLLGGTRLMRAFFKGFDFRNSIQLYVTQRQEFWVVNPKNFDSSLVILGTTHNEGSNYAIEAYDLNLKVVDENGNPIQGAKVYVLDKEGHTALLKDWFALAGWAVDSLSDYSDTDGYFRKYNSDYSSYVHSTPSFLSVGDYFRLRGEYLKITNLIGTGGHFQCLRNQTYNGYTSLGIGEHFSSPLYQEVDYIETNANGEAKFSGEYGDFNPVIVRNCFSEDYDDTRKDREYTPFTITIAKEGYEVVTIPDLDINQETSLVIKLKKAYISPDLEALV